MKKNGEPEYHRTWATTRQHERAAFEQLVDDLVARLDDHPDFHVYHFTPYEPGAMKRLMGRYGTREDEVDRLLRGGRLVDLHGVVRQGLRVGVESYSLKNLEPLYDFQRNQELREASRALLRVEVALELGDARSPAEEAPTAPERLSGPPPPGWRNPVASRPAPGPGAGRRHPAHPGASGLGEDLRCW